MAPGARRSLLSGRKRNETVNELKKDVHKLQKQIDKQSEALVVLADVMKILARRIYGGETEEMDELAQEIYERSLKMVGSWD